MTRQEAGAPDKWLRGTCYFPRAHRRPVWLERAGGGSEGLRQALRTAMGRLGLSLCEMKSLRGSEKGCPAAQPLGGSSWLQHRQWAGPPQDSILGGLGSEGWFPGSLKVTQVGGTL